MKTGIMNYAKPFAVLLIVISFGFCQAQNKSQLSTKGINSAIADAILSNPPDKITRGIIEDNKGNIWIASFGGVFRYDGKTFVNITSGITSARFRCLLEGKNGNYWFGSIGSGVYQYDGKSFRNFTSFTTGKGLIAMGEQSIASDQVTCIYEDRLGNIWFGTSGGISRFDGKSFQTFTTKDGLPDNNVNAILEDKSGKLWLGRGFNTCVYDGTTFAVLKNKDGKPIKTLTVIQDRKGNIWLGGGDGLWRYDRSGFTNLSSQSVDCVIEDNEGNIWTSGVSASGTGTAIELFKTEASFREKITIIESKPPSPRFFCVYKDSKNNIWIGAGDGVYRYERLSITDFHQNATSNFKILEKPK